MTKKGIHFHTRANLTSIKVDESGETGTGGVTRADLDLADPVVARTLAPKTVALDTGDTLAGVDVVMCAAGRHPKLDGLGLERAGVLTNPRTKAVAVDELQRTNVPSVFAVGDCTDTLKLTPVALREANSQMGLPCEGTVRVIEFGPPALRGRTVDRDDVPTAVFSQPNIGTCGLTEGEAVARGRAVKIYKTDFRPLKHTVSGSTERTFMKLVVDRDNDRVLGIHYVGPHAGELMQGFGVAMKCNATKAQFDATVGIHPTSAEEFVTMRTPAYEREPEA